MSTILPLAHIEARFIFDGKKYNVEQFNTEFTQPRDYKGQPQHEIKGGQITLNLTQIIDDAIYLWAKTSTLRKDGKIIFQTDLGMTILEIEFTNAYCSSFTRQINAYSGTNTVLTISPEKVKLNGIEHDNFWAK
jgi:hypothetical protein